MRVPFVCCAAFVAALALVHTPRAHGEDPVAARPEVRSSRVSKVLQVPVADVWAAFTDAEVMKRWMAPRVEVDFRLGGEIRSSYNPDEELGGPSTIVSKILAFEPERMLALQNTQAPEGFPFAEGVKGTWSIFYFEGLEDGSTRVTIVGVGWADTPAAEEARSFFEKANLQVLGALEKVLKGTAKEESH